MASVLHYYAHPGSRASRANAAMWKATKSVEGVERVDLYAEYPRHQIAVAVEQERLRRNDIVVLQFPVFWYSSPSLVKEWIDLTLARGFAYGSGGDALEGKIMQLALTTGGNEQAYTVEGFQGASLRTFLSPFEQTAKLCGMRFLAPYVLYGALNVDPQDHAAGFAEWLTALVADQADLDAAQSAETLSRQQLPVLAGKSQSLQRGHSHG